MSRLSTLSRSRELLKARGALAVGRTEYHDLRTGRSHDLFGFIDAIALFPGRILAIQVTGGGNLSARRAKIAGECRSASLAWIYAGGEIWIHDWRKLKVKRGGKAMRWDCREVQITLKDFASQVWESG